MPWQTFAVQLREEKRLMGTHHIYKLLSNDCVRVKCSYHQWHLSMKVIWIISRCSFTPASKCVCCQAIFPPSSKGCRNNMQNPTAQKLLDRACPELDLQSKQIADCMNQEPGLCLKYVMPAQASQWPLLLRSRREEKMSTSKAAPFWDRLRALWVHTKSGYKII